MKKSKLNFAKLQLNKETIAALNEGKMQMIAGGTRITIGCDTEPLVGCHIIKTKGCIESVDICTSSPTTC